MSANSNFTVAVHILTMLAVAEEPVSSSTAAGSVNTNPVTIRKMAGVLREAGLIDTLPGSSGGMILARSADQITLGEVYRIVQDDHLFGLHPNPPNPNCLVGRNIQGVLNTLLDETDQLVIRALSQITIQAILNQVLEREKSR